MKKIAVTTFSVLAVANVMTMLFGVDTHAAGQLGSMTCNRIAGTGYNLIITSSAEVRCTFKGSGGSEQWYVGKTGVGLGVDLSWKKEQTISFAIVSAAHNFEPEGDFLSGGYGGAKADVAVGKGAGAAVLLGGNEDTISLQPAVETSKGVGVAAGLSYLNIDPDPLNKARIVTPKGNLLARALYAGYFDRGFYYYHRPVYKASDYFAGRALAAATGKPPAPEEPGKWNIPEGDKKDVEAARARLVAAIKKADKRAQVDAATAQVSFDCWVALDKKGLASDGLPCRDSLYAHLTKAEKAIAEAQMAVDLMQDEWFTVLFATDSAGLDIQGKIVVDEALQKLRQLNNARVYVKGNTDRVGSKEYNLALSVKRTDSVMAALAAAGVSQGWFIREAYGKKNPISISRNPHDALNRRVDIIVEPVAVKPEAVRAEAEKKMREKGKNPK